MRLGIALSAAGCLLFLSGCGGSGGLPCGPVSGKITYNGQPVKKVGVYFKPVSNKPEEAGKMGSGATDEQGNYQISTYTVGGNDGAVIGKNKVFFSAGTADWSGKTAAKPPVPVKYLAPDTSGLEFEVKRGKNTIDIDLKD